MECWWLSRTLWKICSVIEQALALTLHAVIEAWFREFGAQPRRIDVGKSLGVVASLTIAGLGIAMLPPSIFKAEKQLMILTTEPNLSDLEFVVAYRRNMSSPLIRSIIEIEESVSTFRLVQPKQI